MQRIEARPTAALSYNPNEPAYWDAAKLATEVERVFDICHGCRLCFNLCPSFPELFKAVDARGDDVRNLTAGERQRVLDLCYECKLCEVKCPYTPRDKHEFQLDFPALVLRSRAVAARAGGLKLREKLLGDPDRTGRMGSKVPALANWSCRNAIQRRVMEKLLGIHRDKQLPEFAGETFEKWIARVGLPPAPAAPAARVAIFHTCFVNYYNPAPGQALVKVLEQNQCAIASPAQNCCGMPALDGGDVAFAQKQARANVATLIPLVREGYKVAAINPTCSLTMRREYPTLLGTPAARELAAAVVDPGELLDTIRRAGRFNLDFRSAPDTVAYHVPCHLKAQAIGLRSRDLMRRIPGVTVTTVDACTAHDGTWAMKKEYFELSMKWGEKAFDGMRAAAADLMTTDCPLAAIQIHQATGTMPLNPIEVIARAYQPDGFARRIEPAPAEPAANAAPAASHEPGTAPSGAPAEEEKS
ncbi:MAG TPA: heterodisulfide reductase-related iron-sulfur binding cluster [Candidatus Binataceae bacterium]|nr:heterodisulfide reductase-related iron-sulfur binding cluster [Candidatus Binataceae bacterium]